MGKAARADRVTGCNGGVWARPDPRGAADFVGRPGLRREEVALVGEVLTDIAVPRARASSRRAF